MNGLLEALCWWQAWGSPPLNKALAVSHWVQVVAGE